MKSIPIFLIFTLFYSSINAQNGYVKLLSNLTINGFIKQNRSIETGELEIEVWLTKKDKTPKTYRLSDITEYAIKKDTFRILTNFYPFEDNDLHFDIVRAKIIQKGKVDLLILNPDITLTFSNAMGGGLIPALIDENLSNYNYNGSIFILSCESKNLLGSVSHQKDEFVNTMKKYFNDDYNLMKKIIDREYKFKHLKTIVKKYNN